MLLAAGTNLEVYDIRKKDSTARNMSFAPHRIDKTLREVVAMTSHQ